MGVRAVRAALADAGNPRSRPRSAAPRTAASRRATRCSARSALTGVPIVDVEAGCASGGAALQLAAAAIRAGQYDCVLVFGIEKMPKGIIRSSFFEPWREEAGLAATPAYFALRAQRLLREAGLTKEHLAQVVVKNRALRRGQPERDVPQARHSRGGARARGSCASRCTCGCCARRMKARPPSCCGAATGGVELAAARLRSHLPGSVLGEATPLAGIDDTEITPPSTLARTRRVRGSRRRPGRPRRRRMPGHRRRPRTARVPRARTVRAGRQAALLVRKRAAPAVNPSGGLLVEGRAVRRVGARPGRRARLATPRRRGPRQVAGARVGLAHTVGRGANACCVIVKQLAGQRARRNQPRGSQPPERVHFGVGRRVERAHRVGDP